MKPGSRQRGASTVGLSSGAFMPRHCRRWQPMAGVSTGDSPHAPGVLAPQYLPLHAAKGGAGVR